MVVVIKIEDFDCDDLVIDSNSNLTTKAGEAVYLQFDWLLYNKYGVPKKDTFHLTEESRMLFECPLLKESTAYNKMKEFNQKLEAMMGGNFVSCLKEPNIHPPLLRLKIKRETKFWLDYAAKKAIEWQCVDDLRNSNKFNSELRFVVKPRAWHYLGKVGCNLVLVHMETRRAEQASDEDVEILI